MRAAMQGPSPKTDVGVLGASTHSPARSTALVGAESPRLDEVQNGLKELKA